MDYIYRISTAGGMTSDTRYPNMLTNYGDFGALQRIAYGTISTATNGITFNNIPQNYQDLRIVCQWKSLYTTGNQDGFYIGSNNVTLGNYSATKLKGDGSSATSSRTTNDYYGAYLGDIASSASSVASGTWSVATIDILNYQSSTNKTAICRISSDLNGAGSVWLSTALFRYTSALNTITVFNYGGSSNAVIGSTAALYGIKASAA